MKTEPLHNVCSTRHAFHIYENAEQLRKEIQAALRSTTSLIFIVGKDQQTRMEKATEGWKALNNKSGYVAKDCGPITNTARLWKIRRV